MAQPRLNLAAQRRQLAVVLTDDQGGDIPDVPSSNARPTETRVADGWLWWRYGGSLPPCPSHITVAQLLAIARLCDEPDPSHRVAGLASKLGPLRRSDPEASDWPWTLGTAGTRGRGFREPLSDWTKLGALSNGLLRLGSDLRQGLLGTPENWRMIGDPFTAGEVESVVPGVIDADLLRACRRTVADLMDQLIGEAGFRLTYRWFGQVGTKAPSKPTWEVARPDTLFATIVMAVGRRLAQGGLVPCAGCAFLIEGRYRNGRGSWSDECKHDRDDKRTHDATYRARPKS